MVWQKGRRRQRRSPKRAALRRGRLNGMEHAVMSATIPVSEPISVPWEPSTTARVSVNAEGAWRSTVGSREVTIAVIDAGFDVHSLLRSVDVTVTKVRPGSIYCGSDPSHGTRVAQLISGARGFYPGVAPRCRLLLIDLPQYC